MTLAQEQTTALDAWLTDWPAPPSEYGLAPFWFWNGEMAPEEITHQLEEMRDKGVTEAFLHARFGLKIAYLSEAWFERVRHSLAEARRLGIKLWLYDDINWPSGRAGGEVLKANGRLEGKHLVFEELSFEGPLSRVSPLPEGEVVYASLHDEHGRMVEDLTCDGEDGWLELDLPKGHWRVRCFLCRRNGLTHPIARPACVDVLNPEAAEEFLRTTHERYWTHFANDFGETIPGFFIDEPGSYHNIFNIHPGAIAWTDGFLREFQQRKGYDLRPRLIALWREEGDEWRQTRCDYYEVLAELYAGWEQRQADWCAEHGVLLVGHQEWEETLAGHIMFCGHLFAGLRPLHVMGVDNIHRGFDGMDGRRLAEKLVSSAAHVEGRSRCMSETYAGSGWRLSLREARRICDWQQVRGINWIVPHAFYYRADGFRRWESPPSLFLQNLFWPHFELLANYARRLSFALSQGRHVAPVAVYYPIHSAWTCYDAAGYRRSGLLPEIGGERCQRLQRRLEDLSKTLQENQLDFDFLDDAAIARAEAGPDGFHLAGEHYRAAILPHAEVMPLATLEKLVQFAHQGGQLLALGAPPTHASSCEDTEALRAIVREVLSVEGAWSDVGSGRAVVAREPSAVPPLLCQIERSVICEPAAPDLRALHRQGEDFDLHFVTSESRRSLTRRLSLLGRGSVYLLEADDGGVALVPARPVGNRMRLEMTFAPGQGRLFLLTERELPASPLPTWESLQAVSGPWKLLLCGQESVLDELRPWNQIGRPLFSGSGVYKAEFELERVEPDKRYLLDLGDVREIASVQLNERRVGTRAWPPYHLEVTSALHQGMNCLEVEVTNTQANEYEETPLPSGLAGPVRLLVGGPDTESDPL